MAGVDVDEEFVAIDGIVATGAHGTAVAPLTASAALDVTWTDLGEVTDAGVTRSQPVTSTTRRGWQNRKKLRTLVTEAAVRFKFVLVQTTEDAVELWNGVALTAGSIVTDPGREWPLIAFDLDMIDTDTDDGDTIREYAPSARVVEVGDQVALAGDGWGWPITVEAEYDTGIGGYTKQFFSKFETGVVPTLATALPTAAPVTHIVKIVGTGFTTVIGSAGVKFGGVNATSYEVISDTEIYAVMPAGSAGSAPVIVTNAVGASSALAYTRGA